MGPQEKSLETAVKAYTAIMCLMVFAIENIKIMRRALWYEF